MPQRLGNIRSHWCLGVLVFLVSWYALARVCSLLDSLAKDKRKNPSLGFVIATRIWPKRFLFLHFPLQFSLTAVCLCRLFFFFFFLSRAALSLWRDCRLRRDRQVLSRPRKVTSSCRGTEYYSVNVCNANYKICSLRKENRAAGQAQCCALWTNGLSQWTHSCVSVAA